MRLSGYERFEHREGAIPLMVVPVPGPTADPFEPRDPLHAQGTGVVTPALNAHPLAKAKAAFDVAGRDTTMTCPLRIVC